MKLVPGRKVPVGFPQPTNDNSHGCSSVKKSWMSPEEIHMRYGMLARGEKVSPIVTMTDPLIEKIQKRATRGKIIG